MTNSKDYNKKLIISQNLINIYLSFVNTFNNVVMYSRFDNIFDMSLRIFEIFYNELLANINLQDITENDLQEKINYYLQDIPTITNNSKITNYLIMATPITILTIKDFIKYINTKLEEGKSSYSSYSN